MRVFVPAAQLVAGELAIRGDEHHYLSRVRRSRAGDAVELVDGTGRRAASVIVRIADTETIVRASAPELVVPAPPHVRALLPLIKGDRMEQCLEKLVEVGVSEIVLWPAIRAVVRLEPARREARLAKFGGQLQAAARQCGRADVPIVRWADSLAAATRDPAVIAGLRILLDPTSEAPLVPGEATDITIVSGPEGGLAPEELDVLAEFVPTGLGPRVLRAETAPVIATAILRDRTRS